MFVVELNMAWFQQGRVVFLLEWRKHGYKFLSPSHISCGLTEALTTCAK